MAAHRIGIIGCGWIAPFHIAALRKLGHAAEIRWVADPDLARARTIAVEAGARAIPEYNAGLQEIDCAFVLVPHHLHEKVTVDCLRAGCHVLLEKPISTTLAEADRMIEEAPLTGRAFMVARPHRYKKSFRFFKQIIESGRYGNLIMLDSLIDDSVEGYLAGWMTHKSTLGGGCLFSAGGHQLDIMLWLKGDVQTAYMVGSRSRVPMEGEDSAACILKFKNGSIGVVRHTWASPKVRVWYTMEAMCERAHVHTDLHASWRSEPGGC
jgi:predicted dehydrogenase